MACRAGRVLAGGEGVGQLGEAEILLGRLALGPLVSVEPNLGRVRKKMRADLHERRPELGVVT